LPDQGALAPPVGLLGLSFSSLAGVSVLADSFSGSLAAVPPPGSEFAPPVSEDSAPVSGVEVSSPVVLDLVVAVEDVDVVEAAAFSAAVLF
jgi:hypothetical protein